MKILLAASVVAAGFLAEPLLKPAGVCDITEGAIVCWDPQGAPNPDLEREIRSRLNENSFFTFLPERKNRYFFAWQDVGSSIRSFSTSGSPMLSLPKAGQKTLIALRSATTPTTKSGSASVTLWVVSGASVDVRFREGETATLDGMKIELGRAQPSPPGRWGGYDPTPWRFGVDHPESFSLNHLFVEALDRKGRPIQFVDTDGKPVDPVKGKAVYDQIQAGKWDWRTTLPILNATFQNWNIGSPEQAGVWIYTNIEPKSIYRLRIRRLVEQPVTLGPYPLDPVQSKTP